MFLPKHSVYNIWCKQTQLFKYPVKSTMLYSKSLRTHFISLTFFDKFDVAHSARRIPALSLILGSLLRKVSVDPSINLVTPLIFFNPLSLNSYPKRLELQAPLIWSIDGWTPLWSEMNVFQRYRQRHTNTTTKLVTARPCHKNLSHKGWIDHARINVSKRGEWSVACFQNLVWLI